MTTWDDQNNDVRQQAEQGLFAGLWSVRTFRSLSVLSAVGLACVVGACAENVPTPSSVSVNSASGELPATLEDKVSTLAAALGEGPYTIGKPIQGYASDFIKEAFSIYDFDTKFIEFSNENSEVCDFTKVALFSDEIDLSEFYWNHPDVSDDLLKKLDQHTYHLNDDLDWVIHFNYHDYRVDRTLSGRAVHRSFNNPILHLCDFGSNYVWEDFGVGYLTLIKNLKKSGGACASEYQLDDEPVFPENVPGSTIGFFFNKNSLYIVTLRLFDYSPFVNSNHFSGVAHRSIKVTKVSIQQNNTLTNKLTPICDYRRVNPSM